jgi:hypothetical protein
VLHGDRYAPQVVVVVVPSSLVWLSPHADTLPPVSTANPCSTPALIETAVLRLLTFVGMLWALSSLVPFPS